MEPLEFKHLLNWIPNLASPDLFNICYPSFSCGAGTTPDYAIPYNIWGYQNAYQKDAYVGIAVFSFNSIYEFDINYREYIQVRLTKKLKSCTEYNLRFFVNLANISAYGSKNIMANVSVDSLQQPFSGMIELPNPTYSGPGYAVVDTIGWTELSHNFIADGEEEWLTIGNFAPPYDSLDLELINPGGYEAIYYYIDMVELCEVPKPPQSIPNIITPNGDGINDGFYVTGMFPNTGLTVYNRWGAEVYKAQEYHNNWQGETQTMGMASTLNDGVYYYVLESPCGGRHTGTVTIAR